MRWQVKAIFALAVAVAADPLLAQGGPFRFFPLTPCRVVNTRTTDCVDGTCPPFDPLQASSDKDPAAPTISFTLRGKCGIPAEAQAVALNVTVFQPSHQGHLRVFPAGGAPPYASTLNWAGGEQAIANGAIVPLGAGAPDLGVYLYAVTTPANAHVILDVTGYFALTTP